ncbi:MAG: hypothetical protein QOF48_1695, partial [Verrucomicrobiota bacterium]
MGSNILAGQMSAIREKLKASLAVLASQGVYVGTSSWKYPGWCGLLYDRDRYITRGKFAETRFERDCLAEYAEVFKTVCVDGAYYRFPERRQIEKLLSQVPGDFLFSFKVTDQITLKHFPSLPRFGERAGRANADFLNADLFASAFLKPFEEFRSNVGLFMFEFSRFYPGDLERGRDFAAALDAFLGGIPRDWPYGIEIRNRNFLHPDYFEVLRRHQVAHVFNNWGDMPSVGEQMVLEGSRPHPQLCGARFLLKPGRKYQEAVE